ncbi:MAG: S1 RNA-binding domain-containing protein, partial [Thiobacillaceae bacterium]|jgi:ribonuclease R|nr:S1 RNA-binding domain-containing protein [Thiobacillaceae bacterium]
VFVEGLVHVSDLGQDYFHYDAARHQMLGERTGQRYRLGDPVRIQVARVDLDTSRVDFVLAEPETASAQPKGTRGEGAGKSASGKTAAEKPAKAPAKSAPATKAKAAAGKAKTSTKGRDQGK